MNRKAFLAIMVAGGMLNSQMPAMSDDEPKSTDSVIQLISNNSQMKPEVRAFYLLRLADRYLQGVEVGAADSEYQFATKERVRVQFRQQDNWWVHFANSLAKRFPNEETNADSHAIAKENLVVATFAMESALAQLDNSSNKFAKLNLYFVAARLFEKMDNVEDMRKCDKVVDDAFESSEESLTADREEIRAASSVLNSMAFGVVPIQISDGPAGQTFVPSLAKSAVPITNRAFRVGEKLKLRAVAMVDRLDASDDLRRMAHRNLALWYTELGKTKIAEKEKQILFKLVGIQDDSILYPQSASCGSLVWWKLEKPDDGFLCGMG